MKVCSSSPVCRVESSFEGSGESKSKPVLLSVKVSLVYPGETLRKNQLSLAVLFRFRPEINFLRRKSKVRCRLRTATPRGVLVEKVFFSGALHGERRMSRKDCKKSSMA